MLRRQQQIRSQIQKLVDAGLFGLGLYLAHMLRSHSELAILGGTLFGGTPEILPFEDYLWLYLLIIPGAPLLLATQGFYSRPLLPSQKLTAWQLLKVCAWMVVGAILVIWLLRESQTIARSVIILFGVISFVLVFLKEQLLLSWLQSKLGQAQLKKKLILLGTAEETTRLRSELMGSRHDGLTVVEVLNLNEAPVESLIDLLHEHSANGVILAAQHTYFGQIERAIEVCEREGVEVWLLADFFKTQISQTTVDDFYGRPMLVFRSAPETSWQALAKHVIDFLGAFVLLVLLAIPMLLVAWLIRLTSPGPVLFRQRRSGLNGEPFTMLKFRSMVSDAEQLKHELEALNEMSGPVFKLTQDPRITPIGRFLRCYSIDELPQLINVVRGEMSLVGPRPLPVDEVKRFDDLAHRRRLSVKPGLTCLWQISGRNNVRDFKDWVRLDLEYIDNWSLWLDLKILLRTIPVVLTGAGAK
jgi:exopolysaccharide biosynthesis polyprenyl glycosylphosphotransferase